MLPDYHIELNSKLISLFKIFLDKTLHAHVLINEPHSPGLRTATYHTGLDVESESHTVCTIKICTAALKEAIYMYMYCHPTNPMVTVTLQLHMYRFYAHRFVLHYDYKRFIMLSHERKQVGLTFMYMYMLFIFLSLLSYPSIPPSLPPSLLPSLPPSPILP